MLSPDREVMTPALKVGAWARAVRTKGMPRVPAASAAALPPTKCRRETERLFDAILQILPCVVAAKPSFSKHTIICPAGAQAQSFMQFGVSRIRWAERALLPRGWPIGGERKRPIQAKLCRLVGLLADGVEDRLAQFLQPGARLRRCCEHRREGGWALSHPGHRFLNHTRQAGGLDLVGLRQDELVGNRGLVEQGKHFLVIGLHTMARVDQDIDPLQRRAAAQIVEHQPCPLFDLVFWRLGIAVARHVHQRHGRQIRAFAGKSAWNKIVELLRSARRAGGARQPFLARQGVDQRRLADIRAPRKGNFRRSRGRQELQRRHATDEHPWPAEQLHVDGGCSIHRAASSLSMSAPRMASRLRLILSCGQFHQATFSRRSTVFSSYCMFTILAGLPATTAYGGTSCVTTDFAATMAPSPILMPGRITASMPIQTSLPTMVSPRFSASQVLTSKPSSQPWPNMLTG